VKSPYSIIETEEPTSGKSLNPGHPDAGALMFIIDIA
jgi:hypothetical protein